MVARDHNMNVLKGLNRRMQSEDIESLEALAIHESTRLAFEKKWNDVEIESDSSIAINNIVSEFHNWKGRHCCNEHSLNAWTILTYLMEKYPKIAIEYTN